MTAVSAPAPSSWGERHDDAADETQAQEPGVAHAAACDRNQSSYENKERFGHGLFTKALLEALGERFAKADHNGDDYHGCYNSGHHDNGCGHDGGCREGC